MMRIARHVGVVSVCALVVCGAGCGKKKGPGQTASGAGGTGGDGGVAAAALHMTSTPVHYAQVSEELHYQATLSEPGTAQWTITAGPNGAQVDEGGNVTWRPTESQAGDQAFTISARTDSGETQQSFTVTAAAAVMEATAQVDPSDPNGATVSVDAPLSSVQGAAVQMDPGALPPGPPVALTISSLQHAPVPPSAGMAGVAPADLRPVELGPTGLAFRHPARLQLPVPAAVMAHGSPIVQTYDYASGKWQKVKLLSVDRDAGLAVAEAQHFSTYVVTPDVKVLDLQLTLGGAGTACADALLVRAPLALALRDIPASAVNGYAGAGASAADVLAGMMPGTALQVFIRVSARAAAATGEQAGWALAAATRQSDGTFKVTLTSDGRAGALAGTPSGLSATDPELAAWLSGARADFVFGGLGSLAGGALATAEASLYLVPASDADRPPPASANALGTEEASVAALAPFSDYDDDCDGVPNTWDPEPRGATAPTVLGLPPGPVHVGVGGTAVFKVSSPQAGVTFNWSASDPSITLVSGMNGMVGTATPSVQGLFQVWATGTAGGASARFGWDLIADPPSVQAANTPPFLAVGASATVVRAGEPVMLLAFGKDAEQAALTYAWAVASGGTLSATIGGTVVFSASQPGDYLVTCVASDGFATSAPATTTISVLSATANRPPGVPSVTPVSAVLQHAAGAPASVTLTATAVDPDGDALSFDFAPDGLTPPTFTLTRDGAHATLQASQDGVYVFYVTATDTHGAVSPWTPVKIQVLAALPAAPVDADHDGYPAGFDCNDLDPTVHPGAREICGDRIDQNCDGRDLAADQCDADGDRFSVAQGDCDDHNPAINPAAAERCDGIDNDCNGQVDDGFGVGATCTAGVGACQAAGRTVCNATFTAVVCDAAPLAPQPERCDGIDNDCNGQVDDLPGQIGGDSGNCGGCGIACPQAPNTLAACLNGGCIAMCATGFVDADRNPANGCECRLTNGGVEICDGIDNDCNGAIDDGAGAIFYDGPPGTLGVGVCAAGVLTCAGGQSTMSRPEQTPAPERCDGLDNDCNGKVDDGFDLMHDPYNCGACAVACAPGQTCQLGRCTTSGGAGTGGSGGGGGFGGGGSGGFGGGGSGGFGGSGGGTAGSGTGGTMGTLSVCSTATGGTICVDLASDPANCGACAHPCGAGQYCNNGACATPPPPDCPQPRILCSDAVDPNKLYCTDPNYDPANCGGCGNRCPQGVGCMAGTCQGTAPPGCPASAPSMCPDHAGGSYCTNFSSDPANCGGCGITCPTSVACQNATCGGGGQSCPPDAPNACMSPTGGMYCANLASDPGNCGGCGVACPMGVLCQNRMCGGSGTTTCPPDKPKSCDTPQKVICTDFLTDPMNCGNCGLVCPAGTPCQNGMCGTSTPVSCGGAAPNGCFGPTGEICTNLLTDAANCGHCGATCPQGIMCTNGVCGGGGPPPGTCPASVPATCMSPTSGTYCADLTIDPANCGACGHACPAGVPCQMSACGGGGTSMCPPGSPNACMSPTGGTFCTDLTRDGGNCGMCGRVCSAGTFCSAGICTTDTASTCSGPFTYCPTGCTSFPDDPRNCGSCGVSCPGICEAGGCRPPGPAPFGAPCMRNGDCMDGLCMDQARFGWPNGFCTTVCDPSRPCPGGQGCVSSPMSSGFGSCRPLCTSDADCASSGTVCGAGTCQPDCRNAPVCGPGQTCDPGGHCLAGTPPPTCNPPMQTCTDSHGQQTFCTDVTRDPGNCGACGNVCPPNALCTNGTCQGGGGSYPGAAACPGTGGAPMCTNLYSDPANCGACGNVCQAGMGCYGGACGTAPPPPMCPQGATTCTDATGKMYCTQISGDPSNCGGCGNVCPAGYACQNATCVAGTPPPDGGTTTAPDGGAPPP